MTGRDPAGALRARMLAWIAHEEDSARRALAETWALPVAERVETGNCQDGLRFLGADARGELLRFAVEDFHAKFREGEPLYLGETDEVEEGWPVGFVSFDAKARIVTLRADRFARGEPPAPRRGGIYRLDRRGLGLSALLTEGLAQVFAGGRDDVVGALLGRFPRGLDEARRRAAEGLRLEPEPTAAQREAFVRAVAGDGLTLVQGPPGTGKTRLLAEIARTLAGLRARVFVTGYTHRAIGNVLVALRALDPRLPVFKLGRPRGEEELVRAGVRFSPTLERLALPPGGVVVGGTPFSLRKLEEPRFHFLLIDEAGQMPVVHGAIAMLAARRRIVAGDPCQLSPVRLGSRHDPELGDSLFLRLQRFAEPILLDRTFRLNDVLADFVSREFYGGRLKPSAEAAGRRLAWTPGGDLAEVVDPRRPLVWARVAHSARRTRSPEEVETVVRLVRVLLERHGLPPGELAVVSPFRAQVRAVRHALERAGLMRSGLVVDTVERMQGQERECLLWTLAASDPEHLERQAEWFFDPGRLNVSISRARTKCILVASPEAFRARPADLECLRAAARFKRLARAAPAVDLRPAGAPAHAP